MYCIRKSGSRMRSGAALLAICRLRSSGGLWVQTRRTVGSQEGSLAMGPIAVQSIRPAGGCYPAGAPRPSCRITWLDASGRTVPQGVVSDDLAAIRVAGLELPKPGVPFVTHPITEEHDCEDCDRNGHSGEDGDPPRAGEEVTAIRHHASPRWRRGGNANAQEAQSSFRENDA